MNANRSDIADNPAGMPRPNASFVVVIGVAGTVGILASTLACAGGLWGWPASTGALAIIGVISSLATIVVGGGRVVNARNSREAADTRSHDGTRTKSVSPLGRISAWVIYVSLVVMTVIGLSFSMWHGDLGGVEHRPVFAIQDTYVLESHRRRTVVSEEYYRVVGTVHAVELWLFCVWMSIAGLYCGKYGRSPFPVRCKKIAKPGQVSVSRRATEVAER